MFRSYSVSKLLKASKRAIKVMPDIGFNKIRAFCSDFVLIIQIYARIIC